MKLSPKFTPPSYCPDTHLNRQRINSFLSEEFNNDIVIEARAGQGKSLAAVQYLKYSDSKFAWYNTGEEDCDTILFITSIYNCLKESIPGFFSEHFEILLSSKSFFLSNTSGYAELLSGELKSYSIENFFIVFDDIHLIEKSPSSISFLQKLLDTIPSHVKTLLISRPTESAEIRSLIDSTGILPAGNDTLSMTRFEIASLYNDVLKQPVSINGVDSIYTSTEGWTMGVIAKTLINTTNQDKSVPIKSITIEEYFKTEIFSYISNPLLHSLSLLSILDEIPVELARLITQTDDIHTELNKLVTKNFFINSTGGKNPVYDFHHLLREQLILHAEKCIKSSEKSATLLKAAIWYLKNNQTEQSVRYFIKAGEFKKVHTILAEDGLDLYTRNRTITLQSMLADIPGREIKRYPWFSFFYGLIMLDNSPVKAKENFSRAEDLFVRDGNTLGELLVATQIIRYHMFVDAQFFIGEIYLKRLEKLYESLSDSLPVIQQINSALALSVAECMVNRDMEKAVFYNNIAMKSARKHNLENSEVSARMNYFCIHLYNVDYSGMKSELERLIRSFSSIRVDGVNKSMIQLGIINLFFLENDYESYQFHKKTLEQNIGKELLEQTVLAPFLIVWEAGLAISRGEINSASELIDRGIERYSQDPTKKHFISQYYHYKAFIAGIIGDAEGVQRYGKRALSLRAQTGGAAFIMLCNLFVGAAYIQLQHYETGESYIEKSISMSTEFGEVYIRTAACFHMAYLGLKTNLRRDVLSDITFCVKTLKEKKFKHFMSWHPDVVQTVFSEAIKHNIDPEFVREFSITNMFTAFDPYGRVIPALRVNTLGRFFISIKGKEILHSEDFTKDQREILGLLLTYPKRTISIKKLQKLLFPQSSLNSRKDRTRLNTALSRLRSVFARALKPYDSGDYLVNKEGSLSLKNSVVDYDMFINHVKKGMKCTGEKKLWQATVEFRKALTLWDYKFMPGFILDTANSGYTESNLINFCYECADSWSSILVNGKGYNETDMALLEKVLMDQPDNTDLSKRLHIIYKREGRTVNALRISRKLICDATV